MSTLPAEVWLLVGPTAVGKTELSLVLAERLGGEVVSLDSRQIYRGLDIGTAKPCPDDLRRVPHHLIDIADPDQTLSLSAILHAARTAIAACLERDRLPILVGGSGQYVRAVAEGWQVPEVMPDRQYRARLEALAREAGPGALAAMLAEADPEAAAAIDPRNVRRVVRALEVCRATGRPFSELRRRVAPPFRCRWVGLHRPREVLYRRIDVRLADMLERGLESEVRGLVDRGYGFDLPSMSGLGYGEWRDCFAGLIDRAEVVTRIRRNTRRLVRSQGAWFPATDERIAWLDPGGAPTGAVADRVIERLCG